MAKLNFVIKNKSSAFIDKRAKIGENVIIYENCRIEGECQIGDNVTILPNSFICNSILGKGSKIYSSIIENCEVGACAYIGGFAFLKNAKLASFVKVGSGATIKNSQLSDYCEVGHNASVIGAEVGKNSKFGALSVVAGQCDKNAQKIVIGSDCFVGAGCVIDKLGSLSSGTTLAAGSVIQLEE